MTSNLRWLFQRLITKKASATCRWRRHPQLNNRSGWNLTVLNIKYTHRGLFCLHEKANKIFLAANGKFPFYFLFHFPLQTKCFILEHFL